MVKCSTKEEITSSEHDIEWFVRKHLPVKTFHQYRGATVQTEVKNRKERNQTYEAQLMLMETFPEIEWDFTCLINDHI